MEGDELIGRMNSYPFLIQHPIGASFRPLMQMCKAIDDPTGGNDTFDKLYGAANIYYNYSGVATCFDLDDNSDPHGLSEWTWQVPEYFPKVFSVTTKPKGPIITFIRRIAPSWIKT